MAAYQVKKIAIIPIKQVFFISIRLLLQADFLLPRMTHKESYYDVRDGREMVSIEIAK